MRAAFLDVFEYIGALQLEIHAVGRAKVFKKGEQLDDVLALDNLNAGVVGFEAFVDGHDHASAGDGEAGSDTGQRDD